MARKRSFPSQLCRAARWSNTIDAAASGNPRRLTRRSKNIALGRALGRAGLWPVVEIIGLAAGSVAPTWAPSLAARHARGR
jgi:hypothetical protein